METETDLNYRVLSYICAGCGSKRDVIVDQSNHSKRHELKTTGLAPYLDIHDDPKSITGDEHGIKLFVDANFHVRSNELLASNKQRRNIISGLPVPSIAVNLQKIMYISRSWNSLQITSSVHNIGFYLINPDPSLSTADYGTEQIESPLGTVNITVAFQQSRIGEEGAQQCLEWLTYLINWIENTASLNIILLPRILFYIDFYTVKPPDLTDELVISILVDASAKFQMTRDFTFEDTEQITEMNSKARQTASEYYHIIGINIDALNAISSKLNDHKMIGILNLVQILQKYKQADQFVDTFILMFNELFRKNAINFKVSHLL